MKTNKKAKKGFTLAELLIVIAIIAVLVAIMFPVFGAQLNKARAAAELANVRAKYSEMVADKMLGTDKDLTSGVNTAITIKPEDLAAACQYDGTIITLTAPTAASGSTPAKEGKVEVKYGDYHGDFNTDTDVALTAGTVTADGNGGVKRP